MKKNKNQWVTHGHNTTHWQQLLATCSPLLEGLKCESQTEVNKRIRSRGTLPGSQHYRGVEGRAGVPRWDQEDLTSFNYSHKLAQNQHKVISAQLEHFWCYDEPRATWTHKTHHNPNLGEATTFPLIIYSTPLHEGHIQMFFFFLGFPGGSLEIPTIRTSTTLGAHNLVCRPLIAMRCQAKL